MTEMNRPRLWISIRGYSDPTMPDRLNNLAPYKENITSKLGIFTGDEHSTGNEAAIHLIYFSPESMLQLLPCLSQLLGILEHVQMGEYTHDLRKSMHLTDVQELKDLHLKTKAGINQQQCL